MGSILKSPQHIDINAPSVIYNEIKTMGEQIWSVDSGILESIGKVFVKHKCHDHLGISLLHRHHELLPGYVMVHSSPAHDKDVCQMESIGFRDIFPSSIYMNKQKQFLPFEYSTTRTPAPKAEFLSDIASFLYDHRLQDLLAVTYVLPSRMPLTEILLENGKGTVATEMKCEIDISRSDCIVTEWAFVVDDRGFHVRALKECKKLEAGGHKQE